MKKTYLFLILSFAFILMMKHNDVLSQERRVSEPTTSRDNWGPTPKPGSIWVNRNDTIKGKPVSTLTPAELVMDVLLGKTGDCTISNVTFKGYGWNQSSNSWTGTPEKRSLSYFSHGEVLSDTVINGYPIVRHLGMESGLLLTTGDGRDAEGPNSEKGGCSSSSPYVSLNGDPDLTPLATSTVKNGAILEFDFVPLQSKISFDYIFASEEYSEYVNESYNDVFGFFIWELNASGGMVPGTYKNIALLPDKSVVSISNVNNGYTNNNIPSGYPGVNPKNAQYFVPNYECYFSSCTYQGKYMEFDGRTVVLTAKATVIPGNKYHLKLAIANVHDEGFGSGVFLRAGSLDLGTGLKNFGESDSLMHHIYEGCQNNKLEIEFLEELSDDLIIGLEYSANANDYICQMGGSAMPSSITISAGTLSGSIPYKVKSGFPTNGAEIEVKATIFSGGDCEMSETLTLVVFRKIAESDLLVTATCLDQKGYIDVQNLTGVGSDNVQISVNGTTWKHISQGIGNLDLGTSYNLLIKDYNSCNVLTVPVTFQGQSVLSSPLRIPGVCNGGTVNYTATCDDPTVTFSWTRTQIFGISPPTSSGTGAIINEPLTNSTNDSIVVTYVFSLLTEDGCSSTQYVKVTVYSNLSQPNPANATIPYGSDYTINLPEVKGGFGTPYYQWQQSVDGITWSPADGNNFYQNYTLSSLIDSMFYRRKAYKAPLGCGDEIFSEPALIKLTCEIKLLMDPDSIPGLNVIGGDVMIPQHSMHTIEAKAGECFTFMYWIDEFNNHITDNPYTFKVDAPRTFIAYFERIPYQITLESSPPGWGILYGMGSYDCGTVIDVKAKAHNCYRFVNWTEFNGTDTVIVSKDSVYNFAVTRHRHLIANFVKDTYKVLAFPILEGWGTVTGGGLNIPCGTPDTLRAFPAKGYVFDRWTGENFDITVCSDSIYPIVVSYNRVVYAHFKKDLFDIYVYVNPPDGAVNDAVGGGFNFPYLSRDTVRAYAGPGYDFVNWTEEGYSLDFPNWEYPFVVTRTRHLTANFAIKQYEIELLSEPPPAGILKGAGTYPHNYTLEVSATSTNKLFYTFDRWTENDSTVCSDPDYPFTVMGPRTLTAHFFTVNHTVNLFVRPNDGGEVEGGGVYPHGTQITVTATENDCRKFLYWEENGEPVEFEPEFTFIVEEDRDLTAVFDTLVFVITTNPIPRFGGITMPKTFQAVCGEEYTVTATPNIGYVFQYWKKGETIVSYDSIYPFTAEETCQLDAYFLPTSHKIMLSAQPAGSGTPETSNMYPHGLALTVYANPKPEFDFVCWTEGEDTVSKNQNYKFTVTRERDLVAHFDTARLSITTAPNLWDAGTTSGDTTGIAYGTWHTVMAEPNACFLFDYWSINDVWVSNSAYFSFPVTQTSHLVAHFKPKKFNIILKVNPVYPELGGLVYATASYNISCGDSITIEAKPLGNFEFVNWTNKDGDTISINKIHELSVTRTDTLTANFKQKKYDIFLSADLPTYGEVWDNHENVLYDSVITVHAQANTGYKFLRWTKLGSTITIYDEPDFTFPVIESMHLVAHFEPKGFDIIPIPEPSYGGTVWDTAYNVTLGTYYVVHALEKTPFFKFDRWTENGITKSYERDYGFYVTESRTLTAHFTPEKFNINLTAVPANTGAVTGGGAIGYGSTITVSAIPDSCHIFAGWFESDTLVWDEPDFTFTVTGDRSLFAHFELKILAFTTTSVPPEGGDAFGDAEDVPCGETRTVWAIPNADYVFDCWKLNGNVVSTKTPYQFPVIDSCILEAHFKGKDFNINLTAVPAHGGEVTGGGAVSFGTTITVSAIPDSCYNFVGWFESDTLVWDKPDFTFKVTGNRSLFAHFEQKILAFTTAAVPPEGGDAFGDAENIPCGETRTVKAVPKTGYIFVNWKIKGKVVSTDSVYTFSVKDFCTLEAHFLYQTHNIKVSTAFPGTGSVCCNGTHPHNSEVTVRVKPNPQYKFRDWTEDGIWVHGDTAYTFIVDRDRELVANFDTATLTITTMANPIEGGTTTGDDTDIPYGETRTVKAFTNPNYRFVNWTEGGIAIQGADTVYSFTVTSSRNLVANFKPKNYNIVLTKEPNYGGWVEGGGYNIPFGTDTLAAAHPGKNYNFAGWFENDVCVCFDTIYKFTVMGDRGLVAKFTPKNYDIRVFAAPMDGGKATGGGLDIVYGEETTVYAEPYPGYVFSHWLEAGYTEPADSRPEWTFTVTRSRDLTAVFEPAVLTVTLLANPEEGGILYGGGTDFAYGDEVTIYATANPYHYFNKWTDENGATVSLDSSYVFRIEKSRTFTAHFTAVTAKITLNSNPVYGGVLTGAGVITQGKLHSITASPNLGYNFVSWTEGSVFITADTLYEFVIGDKDRTFTANFEYKAFKVNVSAKPKAGGTTSGGGEFPQRTNITVTAQPDECYRFINWTEDGVQVSTEKEYTFKVDKNRNLVANFEQITFTVTTLATPPEFGTVTEEITNIPCKQEVTVIATPNIGYKFENWTREETIVSFDSVYTFSVIESCELVANFAENIKTISVTANPPEMGAVSGGGNFLYGEQITVTATPKEGHRLRNWTENGAELSKLESYSFTVTKSRNLEANFEEIQFTITVLPNDSLYGTAIGSGIYMENETVTAVASVKPGYRFLNWTVNDSIVHETNMFVFPAIEDITLIANFYALDFDTYVATLWENTFMLDLKKLADEKLDVTHCKWFKNTKEERNTNTINEFSYSAGPKVTDKLESDPTYYFFQITTKNGSVLYSSRKVLYYYQYAAAPDYNKLFVYPNPVLSGNSFTVENAIAGTLLQVYNQFGVCVKTITATDSVLTLSLNLPAGIYLIRNENKDAKVVITR